MQAFYATRLWRPEACKRGVFRYLGEAHPEGIVFKHNPFRVFECECPLTQNAFWGSLETARHLGPTPRGRLKFGRMLACRTRTARNRRVEGARRSVTGPLSAAFARDMRVGDSDFGEAKTAISRNGDIEPLPNLPKPACLVNSLFRFTHRRRA
eukprot:scaffold15911_cov65-Phaeocystis_antarctica.AAC.2